jgi:hypothetical protein
MNRQELEKLDVNAAAIHLVPESLAREHCILPAGLTNGKLKLVLPENVDGGLDELIRVLRSALGQDFDFDFATREALLEMINLHYLAIGAEIRNCEVRFRFECPRLWSNLQSTSNKLIRHCETCNQDVFYCHTKEELNERARKGQCVAIWDEYVEITILGLPCISSDE